MPLFEIANEKLVPFRRLKGGAELYEKEIEDLLWSNLEDFTGDTLFPIARQAKLPYGGIADVVAMDRTGRLVVFEVKRDIDRKQLAQCLEYAGWARTASLDELAALYANGDEAFWPAWQEFTDSDTPVVVNPKPRLVLIARDFQTATESALDFLVDNGVPVAMIRVVVYEDESGRRFIDVEGEHEPTPTDATPDGDGLEHTKIEGRRVRVRDLLDYGLVTSGDKLEWVRPRNGQVYQATVTGEGFIRLDDGREFTTPSTAAAQAADIGAYDGWYAWNLVRLDRVLNDLRHDLLALVAKGDSASQQ